jgi:WD40 repeat protein
MKFLAIFALLPALSIPSIGKGLDVKELERDKPVDFQSEILPMLRSNCLACHNRTRTKGDVILETPADIRKGNDDGSFVETGKPLDSFLFQIAAHLEDPVMPPAKNKVGAKNFKPQELGLLKLWIAQGAKGEMKAAEPLVWQSYQRETPPIYAVAAGPNGRFAAAGRGNQIHLYDVATGQQIANLADPSLAKHGFYGENDAAHLDVLNALAFHPDGNLLASGGYRVIKLWRRPDPTKTKEFNAKAVDGVRAVSPDGHWLAVAEENNQTGIWDVTQGKRVRGLDKTQPPVKGLAFSADSSRLVSGATDGSVRVWNVADGKLFAETKHEQATGPVAIFGEEGKWFASAHIDKVIRVWALPATAGGEVKMLKELKGHSQDILTLVSMPHDPKQLLSGSKDNTARIWNAESGAAIRSISAGSPVFSLSVSPDGQRIATAGNTNYGRLWNAVTGKKIADLQGNPTLKRESLREDGELAFAKTEQKYFAAEVKKRTDEKKKVIDRKTKAEKDLKTAIEKPIAEKKTAADKARAERDAAEKKVEETTRATEESQPALETAEKSYKDAEAKSKEAAAKVATPEGVERSANQARDKKKSDFEAKKTARDAIINSKLNPIKKKVVQTINALAQAEQVRKQSDDALKAIVTETEKAKQALAAATKKAETAEALAKKTLADPNKPDPEKQKAKQDGEASRKLANDAKTTHANLINAKLNPAKQKLDAADKAIPTAKAAKDSADKARVAVEAELKSAETALAAAEQTFKEAEKKATDSKTAADKIRKIRDDAATVLAERKKIYDAAVKTKSETTKAKTTAEADVKKKEAALTKAEKEYLDLENPRAQFEREVKRSTQDLAKAEAKEKEYEGYKVEADKVEKRETEENKAAKDLSTTVDKAICHTIAFSSDGSIVVTGGEDQHLQFWSGANGKPLDDLEIGEGGTGFVTFGTASQLLVFRGDATTLWDVSRKWEFEKALGGDEAASPVVNRVTSLDFSPDGKQLASGGGDPSRSGEILVWNLSDGKLLHNMPGVHSDTVTAVEFSRDGKRIVSGAADKFARVTEAASGKIIHSFEGHTNHVTGVSLQANGRVLASVGADKEIKVWNVVNGDRVGKVAGYTKEITSIRFVGFGDNALITTADKKAKVIRVPLGNPSNVRDLAGVVDVMHAGDVSRDGKTAVGGGEDGVLRIWNLADGKAVQSFEAPKKEGRDDLTSK